MNINCQPPLQFVYFSTDTHIPWISHNTLRDRLFKNGVAIRKKVYSNRGRRSTFFSVDYTRPDLIIPDLNMFTGDKDV